MNIDESIFDELEPPSLMPRIVKSVRFTYRVPARARLTTERLHVIARDGGWSLFVPAWGDAAPDWLSQTTLTADTHTGQVTFRKGAGSKCWTSFESDQPLERGDSATVTVALQLHKFGVVFEFDPERCSLYH